METIWSYYTRLEIYNLSHHQINKIEHGLFGVKIREADTGHFGFILGHSSPF